MFRILAIAFITLFLLGSGCDLGSRYIFQPSRSIKQTPAAAQLSFSDLYFTTADGIRLHGWLIPGAVDSPLVIFFHGNAANISHRVDILVYLHRLGLACLIFDYRGFGLSHGDPVHEEDLYRDGRAVLVWAREAGFSPLQTIYFGRSLGAAVAMQMALEQPPAALILEGAFTSLPEIAWEVDPLNYGLFGWWSVQAQFDNFGKIDRIQAPLTLIHGDQDPVVPVAMAKKLFRRAGHRQRLLIVKDGGHSDCFEKGAVAYQKAWQEHLGRIRADNRPAKPRS